MDFPPSSLCAIVLQVADLHVHVHDRFWVGKECWLASSAPVFSQTKNEPASTLPAYARVHCVNTSSLTVTTLSFPLSVRSTIGRDTMALVEVGVEDGSFRRTIFEDERCVGSHGC